MKITIKERDYYWLIAYSIEKCKKSLFKDSPYWERYALTSNDQYLNMHHIYSILMNNVECGFAIVPKYKTNLLSSIYVDPEYRGKGIAPTTIDLLEIESLSCIAKNTSAMKSYFKIGFEIDILENFGNESFKLTRNLK